MVYPLTMMKSRSDNSHSLIGGIGGSIYEFGINKILSSITAGFSQPTTTVTDISFTTRTEGKITSFSHFRSK